VAVPVVAVAGQQGRGRHPPNGREQVAGDHLGRVAEPEPNVGVGLPSVVGRKGLADCPGEADTRHGSALPSPGAAGRDRKRRTPLPRSSSDPAVRRQLPDATPLEGVTDPVEGG
jgi:hypothetical protein